LSDTKPAEDGAGDLDAPGQAADVTHSDISDGPGREPSQGQLATSILPNFAREHSNRAHQEWFDRARGMSERSKAMAQESCRIRNNTSLIKQKISTNDLATVNKVNMGFRSHMNQTSEMVRRLNEAIRNNQMEANNLNEGKRQMLKIKEEIETPLVICQKRLDMQHSRPQRECVEDNLHMALELEKNDLTNLLNQLNATIDAANDMLNRLADSRQRMTDDRDGKKHAMKLDTLCLKLTPKEAPHHPPKLETIHSKASVLFGDVPPSVPTSVLMGENAAGRFNYEWLFKKEERDLIRAAYEQLADTVTGKLSNMDFRALLTHSKLEVDPKAAHPILNVIEMHSENSLTWEQSLQNLAQCRGETDHVVQLQPVWKARTKRDLDENYTLLMAAGRLRYQACELASYADETRRKDRLFTQKNLRRKIQETTELKDLAQRRIIEANLEIKRLEEQEKDLGKTYEQKSVPLMLTEARYNIRRRRRQREDIHDEVEDLLGLEVSDLQESVMALQREMDLTRHTLDKLKENRHNLEEDYADKAWCLELYKRCIKLDLQNTPTARRAARGLVVTGV